jgi:hypothetical protein
MPPMSLPAKLQIPKGMKVHVINPPSGFEVDAPKGVGSQVGVLLFARDSATLKRIGKPVIEAAKDDRLAWIAYPKGSQLGTDLNRDALRTMLEPKGIQPVRQVSLDETWSAMRFRPA